MGLASEKKIAVKHLGTVTQENWDRLFAVVDVARHKSAGHMAGLELLDEGPPARFSAPYFDYSQEWMDVYQAFYEENIFVAVDWMSFDGVGDPGWFPGDPAEALMALVFYIRRDRFVEGSLNHDIANGSFLYAVSVLEDAYRTKSR